MFMNTTAMRATTSMIVRALVPRSYIVSMLTLLVKSLAVLFKFAF